MIIIGFPGIGKSSVTRAYDGDTNTTGYVDLESSNFVKDDNWVKEYCDIAIDLELQGYNVFVSSHKKVREYLAERQDVFPDIVEVFPSKEIRTEWLNKLECRYMKCKTDKNERALSYMRNNFDSAVDEMENDAIIHDVNGSLQIMRKVFPNAFADGIVACLTPVRINLIDSNKSHQ